MRLLQQLGGCLQAEQGVVPRAGDPSFVDCELYYSAGDRVLLPPAGYSGVGWMVAGTQDGPEEAAKAMQRLLEGVVIGLKAEETVEQAEG